MNDDNHFETQLATDLRRIYERGLPKKLEAEEVPASTELAETFSGESTAAEEGYYRLQNEILLRAAIQGIRGDADRERGLEKLFGISGDEVLGLQARRENAADLLGYKDAETLRRGEVKKRPFRDVLLGELLAGMLALASERNFAYTARYVRARPASGAGVPDESGRSPDADAPPNGRRLPRRRWLTAAVVALVAAVVTIILATSASTDDHKAAHFQAWGPNRPVYDYNQFNGNNNCDDPSNPARYYGRCGAQVNYPVFDSFINTPSYGDERSFFDGYRSDHANGRAEDPVTDVTSGSKTVTLRVYVDNMAQVYPGAPNKTTAYNARVRVALPGDTGNEQLAYAYISAERATTVYNSVRLIGGRPFLLEYIPGSAVLLRDNHSYRLSDEIIGSEGAPIGVNEMNGVLPPSDNFSTVGLVELKVRAVPQASTS
jgi:hypothetical protein